MGAEGLENRSTGLFAGGAQSAPLVLCKFPFFFLIINLKEEDNIQLVLKIGGLSVQKLLMSVVLHFPGGRAQTS